MGTGRIPYPGPFVSRTIPRRSWTSAPPCVPAANQDVTASARCSSDCYARLAMPRPPCTAMAETAQETTGPTLPHAGATGIRSNRLPCSSVPRKGIWGGLYSLPEFPPPPAACRGTIAATTRAGKPGLPCARGPKILHKFSHFRPAYHAAGPAALRWFSAAYPGILFHRYIA